MKMFQYSIKKMNDTFTIKIFYYLINDYKSQCKVYKYTFIKNV